MPKAYPFAPFVFKVARASLPFKSDLTVDANWVGLNPFALLNPSHPRSLSLTGGPASPGHLPQPPGASVSRACASAMACAAWEGRAKSTLRPCNVYLHLMRARVPHSRPLPTPIPSAPMTATLTASLPCERPVAISTIRSHSALPCLPFNSLEACRAPGLLVELKPPKYPKSPFSAVELPRHRRRPRGSFAITLASLRAPLHLENIP